MSLKARLGVGAAILGGGTLLTTLIFSLGLNAVAERLDTALASETRMVRYATLSQQVSTFLVVATEMVQSGQPRAIRQDRIAPVTNQLAGTFSALRADTQAAVEAARDLGIDAQSRYGTQSLGLARMEALLNNTVVGLSGDTSDRDELRAYIDGFASGFDPLLSQAVNTEIMFRNSILAGIEGLRQRLMLIALGIACLTLLLVAGFYFGLVRPQFARLDSLRDAATRIGQEDFDIHLKVTRQDEIGRLATETNRMASALSERQARVQAEWDRLNDTIAQRTEALRTANASLEETDENRRRFFADVSHELRTPLTVILMEAQIGRQASPEAAEAFATIEARASRLNRRIDDLLRIARSDSGQLELDPHPIELAALLDGVTEEVAAEVASAGMTLETPVVPQATVLCDHNWMRQVLVSLIRNAIRHARAGGLIHLAARQDGEDVVISVSDNGPGIPDELRDKLFDRFAQGNGPGKSQGFGVGLALARWVMIEQGGSMSLVSPASGSAAPGTKVEMRLPARNDTLAP